MRQGGWIPVDKNLRHYLPKGRAYSVIEAYLSFRIDLDEGRPWTVNGYAALWGWDRKRVRRFTSELGSGTGQFRDTLGTPLAHMIRNVFADLEDGRDRVGTGKGQGRDNPEDTTIKPNTNTNTKPLSSPLEGEGEEGGDKVKVEVVFSAPVMWISHKLAELILHNNPKNRELQDAKREATVLRWAKDVDKMIRLDNREAREIAEVVIWCQKDPFWSQSILSGAKLREQYDKLTLKMKGTALALVKPAAGRSKTESNIDAARQAAALLGMGGDETE